jgi:signal peptidase II
MSEEPTDSKPASPAAEAASTAAAAAPEALALPPGAEEPAGKSSGDGGDGVYAPGIERLTAPAFVAKTIPHPVLDPPSGVFLIVVAVISFVLDIGSKIWAEKRLELDPRTMPVMENHLAFTLAKNHGGAWGLLQTSDESIRRPFFLIVSVLAISFIVTLYRRLHPSQTALKWGLPLVLGGALGNVFDRIRYGYVIDFIDYNAAWVHKMNELLAKGNPKIFITDHWPTFNIADVAICVGVGLMAVDMFTSKRGANGEAPPPVAS